MFNKYLKEIAEIYKTGNFLEHTFRTQFENLLNEFLKENIERGAKALRFRIIHEPQREKFGAPDFKIIDKANNIIGYIECKNITEDIKGLVDSPQIRKYLEITNNLILTNYIDFILFKNGEISSHCSISSILDFKGKPQARMSVEQGEAIKDLFRKFFLTAPELTTSTKKLSLELAKRTRILHDFILEEMETPSVPLEKGDVEGGAGHYHKVYKTFKTIIADLEIDLFVDMYSQIMSFGLLFFRLSKDLILTRDNILSNIPHYIPLLKDVFHNARFDKWSGNTLWILDEILLLLNNVDVNIVKESLSYKNLSLLTKRDKNLTDPFLFFYEEFLKVYDKKTKVSRGVFYTPESVVSFIIRSLDCILKDKLDVKKGFLDSSIKILDFATGTGTFILALIEYIKDELRRTNNYGLFNTEVNEFILENIYGFELL
ncbi:MAG TPA: N-6 DNA methylase, partial [Spirochaetota bacterium]|nr:N-6 DNA methylase [Spirochaetota bacterium]